MRWADVVKLSRLLSTWQNLSAILTAAVGHIPNDSEPKAVISAPVSHSASFRLNLHLPQIFLPLISFSKFKK